MNLSYWERDFFLEQPDVAVVGSGIVGLTTAIYLKTLKKELSVSVYERGTLPTGASTKNAGFACFGSITELIDDTQQSNLNTTLKTVEKRWKGLQRLISLLDKSAMDFQQLGGYELFTKEDLRLYPNLEEEINNYNTALKSIIGEDVFSFKNEHIKSFGFNAISQLVYNRFEGQINTGLLMKSLVNKCRDLGITIHNGVTVERVEQTANSVQLKTSLGTIKAKQVAICTNAFSKQLFPELEVIPGRAQVLVTHPIEDLKFKGTFHYKQGYYYFRNIGNRLLIGGGRNEAKDDETTEKFGTTPLIQKHIEHLIDNHILPDTPYTIDMRWSGIMGLGKDKTTILKSVSPNIHVGVRLGGMGVAIGSEVGYQLAQLIRKSC